MDTRFQTRILPVGFIMFILIHEDIIHMTNNYTNSSSSSSSSINAVVDFGLQVVAHCIKQISFIRVGKIVLMTIKLLIYLEIKNLKQNKK
ncbi:hypothetical protein BpHYR1_053857 [Brachionus plicatilis]|uniref:Uncharacterized protein n=1 Tax=Brachionus plicatilis TaxID=10195 RepID=A0A3M7Q6T8_BRAPC|nr:hypothetical protein BpHYR1_053857 [Brachionus plicatilis]